MCAYVLHQKRKREVNSINTFWCFGQFSFITKLYISFETLSLFLSLPISFSFTLLSRSAFLSLPSKTRSLSHLFLLISTHIRARFFSSLSPSLTFSYSICCFWWWFSRSNTFIILFFFLITFVSVQTTEIVLQRVHHQLLHIVVQRLTVVRAQHGIHSRGTNRVDFRLDDVQIQILQHANNLRQQPRSVRSFNQQLGLGPVGDGGHRDSRRHNLSLLLRRSHVFGFRIVCHFVRLWVSRCLLHKLLRFRVIIAHSRQHRLSQILQSRRRRNLLRTLVVRHVEAVLVAFRNFRSGNIQTQISNRFAGIRELPEFVSKLNLEDSRQRVRQVIDDNFRDDFLRFVRRRSARDDNARSAGRFRRRCRSVCYYCFCRLI